MSEPSQWTVECEKYPLVDRRAPHGVFDVAHPGWSIDGIGGIARRCHLVLIGANS